mgnify:CR=1 FL=1
MLRQPEHPARVALAHRVVPAREDETALPLPREHLRREIDRQSVLFDLDPLNERCTKFCALHKFQHTRIRMLDENLLPDWSYKGPPQDAPTNLTPWFHHSEVELPKDRRVIFGHWAALGLFQNENVVALDTGCVWRRSLSAFNIKTGQVVQVERVHP